MVGAGRWRYTMLLSRWLHRKVQSRSKEFKTAVPIAKEEALANKRKYILQEPSLWTMH